VFSGKYPNDWWTAIHIGRSAGCFENMHTGSTIH
jgi:hypothetical protein